MTEYHPQETKPPNPMNLTLSLRAGILLLGVACLPLAGCKAKDDSTTSTNAANAMPTPTPTSMMPTPTPTSMMPTPTPTSMANTGTGTMNTGTSTITQDTQPNTNSQVTTQPTPTPTQ
jgi:hypothetical protein